MAQILVPTQSYEDWRRLLARPDRHWKAGFSAMTLARSWEEARGFPAEVDAILRSSRQSELEGLEPLLIVPEYQIPLPGGTRASQTDVFVLGRAATGLVTIAVEGKVDEAFGPTVSERRTDNSEGVEIRLKFLLQCLGLSEIPGSIRYQLLHRTASAVIAAQQFFAPIRKDAPTALVRPLESFLVRHQPIVATDNPKDPMAGDIDDGLLASCRKAALTRLVPHHDINGMLFDWEQHLLQLTQSHCELLSSGAQIRSIGLGISPLAGRLLGV